MKKLLLATIILSFAVSAHAATIYVDANGTGTNNGSRWKSVGFWYQLPHLLEDIDENGIVNFEDYSKFASYWNQSDCNTCGYADFTGDGKVSYEDLEELADSWLSQMQ